jgi:hypothetical protein
MPALGPQSTIGFISAGAVGGTLAGIVKLMKNRLRHLSLEES